MLVITTVTPEINRTINGRMPACRIRAASRLGVFRPIVYAVCSAAISYAPTEANRYGDAGRGTVGGLWDCITGTNAQPGGAVMKPLQVGDRVKILGGGKDDEGTVLDVDEGTEMVIVYLGRHVGGRPFHRDNLRKVRVH